MSHLLEFNFGIVPGIPNVLHWVVILDSVVYWSTAQNRNVVLVVVFVAGGMKSVGYFL